MKTIKLSEFLEVGSKPFYPATVTKVTFTKYGAKVRLMTSYVTIYDIRIVMTEKSFKMHFKVDQNYRPTERFTYYYTADGNVISRKEYKQLTTN